MPNPEILHIPFVLDNLAEAVEHAIVVLSACDGGTGLKLTVRRKVFSPTGHRVIPSGLLTLVS